METFDNGRRVVQPSPEQNEHLPGVSFPGFSPPRDDVQAVRDDRRSKPLYYTVDLSTARSFAAGTALLLPIQGNVFYSDPLFDLSGNSLAGIARVHFQDQNISPVGTYLTILPQFIGHLPFTQLAIENQAQAGKFLQIIYGWDLDLQPGTSNNVQITGIPTVVDVGFSWATSYKSTTALLANTPENIFSAASNTLGGTLWEASAYSANGAVINNYASYLMKATAPGTVIDGDVLAVTRQNSAAGVFSSGHVWHSRSIRFAAGKRLDYIATNAEAGALRAALYSLN